MNGKTKEKTRPAQETPPDCMGKDLAKISPENESGQTPTDEATCKALTLLALDVLHGSENLNVVCSYDSSTRDGAKRRERAECDAKDNGTMYVNKELQIVAFTATRTELLDDKGDVHSVPILTLEMANGDMVNLFSGPALRCFIGRLRCHLFDGPLNAQHPLVLRLVQYQTQGQRKMYWLERP